jgi:hypothetical protein
MVALLDTTPVRGAPTAHNTLVELSREVVATVFRQAQRRPMLACRWQQDADGRLFCQWDLELPGIPVPPH